MDYSNTKYVRWKIIKGLLLIAAVFLLSSSISHALFKINFIIRWISVIAVGIICCDIWGSIVAYNVSTGYKSKIRKLEDEIRNVGRN